MIRTTGRWWSSYIPGRGGSGNTSRRGGRSPSTPPTLADGERRRHVQGTGGGGRGAPKEGTPKPRLDPPRDLSVHRQARLLPKKRQPHPGQGPAAQVAHPQGPGCRQAGAGPPGRARNHGPPEGGETQGGLRRCPRLTQRGRPCRLAPMLPEAREADGREGVARRTQKYTRERAIEIQR